MNTYVQFKTNIPEFVTFKFDQPKEFPNKYKPGELQYSYGVEWRGQDAYMTATPRLNEMLQALPKRQGQTIQILKYEDGTAKLWKIMDEHGIDITPGATQAPTRPLPPQQTHLPIPQDMGALEAKIRAAFQKRDERITELEKTVAECVGQVEYFKELWKTQNPDAAKVHKDQIPVIKEDGSWADQVSNELGL